MASRRLQGIPGFSIDRVADAAGNDPEVLRLENLDTDLPPPPEAIAATQSALSRDEANSYLPFTGSFELRQAIAARLKSQTGFTYPENQIVVTAGGTEGMFDALLATIDPEDEVVLTDPTYAGMIYRVRLASGIPRLVPFRLQDNTWRLDIKALNNATNNKTRVLFLMSPSMPSGAVFNQEEWNAIAQLCRAQSLWLIYIAAMERILYDSNVFIHPASLPEMYERTIIVGSVSKEFRMIGWRIGWVAGPASIMPDIGRVHIYNVVTPPGVTQAGAVAAFRTPESDFYACLSEWKKRRDEMLKQMEGFPIIPAAGGWSMLLDVGSMGYDSFKASSLLLENGKIAATPMKDWGEANGDRFVRFVFSNEPVYRLATLRSRVFAALR
ncbi:pyridoxal phosphate-dependent aminotransferase [bacterium]|nr:pyridoxal phosphate-dependent aminotransferase [bacterium]